MTQRDLARGVKLSAEVPFKYSEVATSALGKKTPSIMDSEFSACALPLYSPSHPSPCYSQDPAYDEIRLDSSPRTGTGVLPTGIFTKACGSATVVQLRIYPLPPSYNAKFPGFPALFAKCTYSLTISITKERRLGFLSKTKIIRVPVEYHPRASPPRGVSPTPLYFLSAVKMMPEEWHQSSFAMNTRCSSNLAPIQCQMSGPLSSLRAFILPSSPSPGDIDDGKGPVRLCLTRMVSFEYRGKTIWRVMRIGDGRFRPLPPWRTSTATAPPCAFPTTRVKYDPGTTVGDFQSAGLTAKDFIALELIPPKPVSSPLLAMQDAISIRLVTETFSDVAT
ncbi:hypothetical protein B0H17DRAFT_1183202 [Mycena rosella]|uniref:Uncharacterized protein n=1 Tax=Mycena rosella TaxID=1033263 RepID=A0AAD7D0Z2_MYCRO|nr:hypothetical protein B0H17DRAFT_1183202 [Mycena rosella]